MNKIYAIPWYRQEDYPAVLQIMDDAESIPSPYHLWREGAEFVERRKQAAGWTIVRVVIDADEFKRWCDERKLRLDSNARKAFATERAIASHGAH